MPLSPEKAALLQRLEAEVARRMASSNAVPNQPSIPQVESAAVVGSTAQLNQAVQDASNVGQQEGGFMAGLKEVFRGIGTGGGGLSGGEVLRAPIAGAETPEGQKFRQAARFQAATGAGIVAPELLAAAVPEVAAGMTAAGGATRLARTGQFLERSGAQALGGGTGGAATGAVEALTNIGPFSSNTFVPYSS